MERISPRKQGVIEGKIADITMKTNNNEGIDPIELIARIKNLQISQGSGHTTSTTPKAASSKVEKRPWPTNWPVKQDMYAHFNITTERHRENMCLLLQDFALKARHTARLTRNWEGGEVWPTVVEPAALELSETMNNYGIDWRNVQYRPDYAEELDFVWRCWSTELSANHINHKIIWEYVTGIARTWDQGRKASGVWFHNDEEEHRKKRCPGRNYHLVKNLRVPTIPQAIRTNKFIGVGDDETACICSRPSPQCHRRCVHREQIARIKYLKKKNREAIPAPVAEDMDELDCIE
ncbi:hypothetical protein HO173_011787 [Letharia columbiana]|uniref:Uncharacterized protein n=1 Tax=Letharia columbiana TaxID=112416 RepID=A0A8H6CT26_9LECA|nr:uncharacterized protein HO173_011787 [Letharia columbiana]KAF6228616.1 hypothetical protein HO173_011787 [Letharia columbiana]